MLREQPGCTWTREAGYIQEVRGIGEFAKHGSKFYKEQEGLRKNRKGVGLGKMRHCMKERVWKRDQEQDQGVSDENAGEILL